MNENKKDLTFYTGIDSLDDVLHGLHPGDNVVWQLEHLDDYLHFIIPFCRRANKDKKPLIYFRFAKHKYLLPEDIKVDCYSLNAHEGFEKFVSDIFSVIEKYGIGACYVFDSLSELSVDWYSDRMLGNFFMLVCPYLYKFDTIAYFALKRNFHSFHATDGVHGTSQIVIDVYSDKEKIYIQPHKVDNRFSPTMYMLHLWEGEKFNPVTNSALISEILAAVPQPWVDFKIHRLGEWTRIFLEAEELMELTQSNDISKKEIDKCRKRLIRMAFTRDKRFCKLAMEYMNLKDLLDVRKRMIGTGLIGGKSVGMVIARSILTKTNKRYKDLQEAHDSFFIGSDVFVTFLVKNGCWHDRKKLHDVSIEDDLIEKSKQKIIKGDFPSYILDQFSEMLHYFGQSPIIVRSSSLLEDAYGNAFSGKYESVFCANQGTPEERLKSFIDAVKTVYASTLNHDVLSYRAHKGLLDKDEQMAILVQRVSGEFYGDIYFPHLAGVGYSFNPFAWNHKINADDGVLRLVFGLGTHAVDRVGEDYTRVVALNEPLLRPESNFDAVSRYSQKMVDILDLKENIYTTWEFESVFKKAERIPWDIITSRNYDMEARANDMGVENVFSHNLTFDQLLADGAFLEDMKGILSILEKTYGCPVDIEFCVNFVDDSSYRINVLQCRPFQITKTNKEVKELKEIKEENIIIKTSGPFIGQSVFKKIDKIIYVVPERYAKLKSSERYSVARLIGELSNSLERKSNIMLIGPGRWGTAMPELGIPVSFSEIRNTSVLCEVVMMHEGLVPDLSLGTHFFNDLVEMDVLYMAFLPGLEKYIWNRAIIEKAENSLTTVKKDAEKWKSTVIVLDSNTLDKKKNIYLHADTLNQEGVLFLK